MWAHVVAFKLRVVDDGVGLPWVFDGAGRSGGSVWVDSQLGGRYYQNEYAEFDSRFLAPGFYHARGDFCVSPTGVGVGDLDLREYG